MSKAPNASTALEERHGQQAKPRPSYLIKLQPGDGSTSVFCFLYSGGFRREFSTFAKLAPAVGRNYSFFGVIAQGTDGVSKHHRSVEEMASAYIREIRTVQPIGPYFILGECFSAPVAIETAKQLLAAGESIALLGLLDARKRPDGMNRYLGNQISALVRHYLTYITDSQTWIRLRTDVPFHAGELKRLHGVKRIGYLLDKAGTAVGLTLRVLSSQKKPPSKPESGERKPADPNPDERVKASNLKRAYNGYSLTVRRYDPQPYSGRILVIANEEWHKSDPTLGWVAAGGLEVYTIPGNHNTYMNDHLPMVADLLRGSIERARRASGGIKD